MKKMEIKQVKIKDLRASEYNPRSWDDAAIAHLTESIQKFGMVDPLIVNSAPKRRNVVIGATFA